jgi:Tfp pilus assembly protein PilO
MTGTYHDFGRFIGYVANYPFIANISDMELTSLNVAIGKAAVENVGPEEVKRKETMSAVFTLSTYFVKEDERLEELAL